MSDYEKFEIIKEKARQRLHGFIKEQYPNLELSGDTSPWAEESFGMACDTLITEALLENQ